MASKSGVFERLWRGPLAFLCGSVIWCACSLATSPDPDTEHVRCDLRYLPRSSGHDLEFTAWSQPYDPEDFLLSLPDQLVHAVAAPGRHLSSPLTATGVDCRRPLWSKGFRLPMHPVGSEVLRCSRREASAVSFRVETRWGSCLASIAEGSDRVEYQFRPAARAADSN